MEVFSIRNAISSPSHSKVKKKKNRDITKPHYSKHIFSVPRPFVISKFHCILKTGLD